MASNYGGGHAFPYHSDNYGGGGYAGDRSQPGMSLRDWFAGQALMGFAASMSEERKKLIWDGTQGGGIEAGAAYRLADAMIARRDKTG